MQKRTICPMTCPMINAQGFCESAWAARRAGARMPTRSAAAKDAQATQKVNIPAF